MSSDLSLNSNPRPAGKEVHHWKPGQSGNPSGRPKGIKTLQMLARQRTEDALNAIIQVMNESKNPIARVQAAKIILDRGWGKAIQTIVGDPDQPLQNQVRIVFVDPGEVPTPVAPPEFLTTRTPAITLQNTEEDE